MAEVKPIPIQQDSQTLLDKGLLTSFKFGRDAALQLSKVERNLWTDIEEQQSGKVIISGIEKNVTELDFAAFNLAAAQILYNQSWQSGNADINSGIQREEAITLSQKLGEKLYNGNIVTSLNELCRQAYGTITTENRKRMAALLDTIDRKPVVIKFHNGDIQESKLCVIMDRYTREKDGAIFYNLYLNPIFGSRIKNQFGELPQDIVAKLDEACKKRKQRKQAAHYLLLRWLSVQDKRCNHTLTIDTIVDELRMEAYFKKNRSMADKQLLSICQVMEDIGILSSYDVEYSSGRKKFIAKVTFLLNKDFIRPQKRIESKEKEENS